jgi:hypothetical protein
MLARCFSSTSFSWRCAISSCSLPARSRDARMTSLLRTWYAPGRGRRGGIAIFIGDGDQQPHRLLARVLDERVGRQTSVALDRMTMAPPPLSVAETDSATGYVLPLIVPWIEPGEPVEPGASVPPGGPDDLVLVQAMRTANGRRRNTMQRIGAPLQQHASASRRRT